MTLEELKSKVKKTEKGVVVCLLAGLQSSINYYSNEITDLYVITNGNVYKNYIQNLIKSHRSVHVVIQYTSIEAIMKIFKFLYEIDPSDSVIPTPITIVYDSSEIENLQLSPDFVLTQQIIRFLSMKHGASIMSLQNISEVATVDRISDILQLDNLAPKPIYESTPERFNSLQVNLYIPSSWDSWNKVVVQGKSFVLPDTDQIIRDEAKLQQLDNTYDKFLQGQGELRDVIRNWTPGQPKPTADGATHTASLSDMLREIVQPSVVE